MNVRHLSLVAALFAACAGDSPSPNGGEDPPPAPTSTSGDAPSAIGSEDATPPSASDAQAPAEPKPMAAALPALDELLLALANGDVHTALEGSAEQLAAHPAHPRALFVRALALHKAKRYAEAAPLFVAARAAETTFEGADAIPYYQGWCAYWLADFETARASFAEVPGNPDGHFGLGIIALELGDLETAKDELELARDGFQARFDGGDLESARDLSKTFARMADVDLANDDDLSAKDDLQAALALDAERPAVWFKLYNVALAIGDAQLAALAKRKYEALSPNTDELSPMGAGGGQ